MPQMFPISWLVIFLLVEMMLVLFFFLISYSIFKFDFDNKGFVLNFDKNIWLW